MLKGLNQYDAIPTGANATDAKSPWVNLGCADFADFGRTFVGPAKEWIETQVLGESPYRRAVITTNAVAVDGNQDRCNELQMAALHSFWPDVEFVRLVPSPVAVEEVPS